MNICVVGMGYVGLVTSACFSTKYNVMGIDIKKEIVDNLRKGGVHIYEPKLKEMIENSIQKGKLWFDTNLENAVLNSDIVFICVNTPSDSLGQYDLTYVLAVSEQIGKILSNKRGTTIVVCKSTLPPNGHKEVINIIKNNNPLDNWVYVSNPETLSEGTAIKDFMEPDRIILGTENQEVIDIMKKLYHSICSQTVYCVGKPIDAELAKLFSNTTLALRVGMVNEFSRIADKFSESDIGHILEMVCFDKRIGSSFMKPGPGYGGSCFPKDVEGLVHSANGVFSPILENLNYSNQVHQLAITDKIHSIIPKGVITVWGLTFKAGTDDIRDSPSITIMRQLVQFGYTIQLHDPMFKQLPDDLKSKVQVYKSKYDSLIDSQAVILLTDWQEYKDVDFQAVKESLKGNVIFDFRNMWYPLFVTSQGLNYYSLGKNYPFLAENLNRIEQI